jgi:ATP-binding cassette, subfamily B, multidrug efflux pump
VWHDYGYMEESPHRQIYDLRLIRRLLTYARPYSAVLALTALLIVAATATDLVFPYLTKIAVDRYIIVSANRVNLVEARNPEIRTLIETHKDSWQYSGQPGIYFINADILKKTDPAVIQRLKSSPAFSSESYYLVTEPSEPEIEIITKYRTYIDSYPNLSAINIRDFKFLKREDLISLRRDDITGLAKIAIFAVVALISGFLFQFGQVVLLEYSGQRITHDLRQELMAHVLRQSIAFHDKTATGRLVARLTNDIQNLGEMIKSVAVTFFQDSLILCGIVVILLYLNYRLALVTFCLLPPIIVLTMFFRRQAREVFRVLRAKVSQINSVFSETIAGIRIIQAFRREHENVRLFEVLNHENYLAGVKQIRVFAVFMPLIEVLASIGLALIIWYGGWSVIKGTMTLGAVIAFIAYLRKFFQPIREMAEKFNILQSALASLERIFKLLDEDDSLPESRWVPDNAPVKGSIIFDRVYFGYQPGEPVLRDLSFSLEPGRTMAIVGATGAGKTSIINLLLRFYDVNQGRILIDGSDIRDLPLAKHRERIGLVMQDVFLFAGTVRENIAFTRNNMPDREIEQAARLVGAHDFISRLPDGYDQRLGEGGMSLSLGERQLLAFARVLAQDPNILILDEATAFVDSETEKLIEEGVRRLIQGRTSIVIAHRLSTIRRADQILVLHNGQAMEQGTHQELMARRGHYARLHDLQFRPLTR